MFLACFGRHPSRFIMLLKFIRKEIRTFRRLPTL
jgi:hypothetical protein